jgi:hypothetical protein
VVVKRAPSNQSRPARSKRLSASPPHRFAIRIFCTLLFVAGASVPAWAQDSLSASSDAGYARILLTLSPHGQAQPSIDSGVLTLAFSRPISIDPAQIAQAVPSYVASARVDPDKKTFRLALAQSVRLHTSMSGDRIAIDLLPAGLTVTPPDLPSPPPPAPVAVDIGKLGPLKIHVGTYTNFTRLVFDWPRAVPYAVFPGAGKITLRFEAVVRPDLSAIVRVKPAWLKNVGWRIEGDGTIVELETDSDSGYHDFRDGTRVVVDVMAPKTDATANNPPGAAKPSAIVLAQNSPATKSEAAAIAVADGRLVPPPVQPGPGATAANAATAPGSAPPVVSSITAVAQPLRDGIALTFAGAGNRPVAVFMRGLTAWIVLEGAQAFDPVKLKASLGNFPATVDATSGDRLSMLRIGLQTPSEISAHAIGDTLKVAISGIASDVPPAAIGLARDEDGPVPESLSTPLPMADRAIAMVDPSAGDTLVIVPAEAGRGIVSPRSFVEFALLKSAAGLVVTPFTDTLDVRVKDERVTIAAKGGLTLTQPLLPALRAAMFTRARASQSFLDFVGWGRMEGPSFLRMERHLRDSIARADTANLTQDHLALARFYLANKFAAEALGVLDLIQESNPGLQSDQQLQTMRAAADYLMGRFREARNDLASSAFDGDRHVMLWRGLVDAALENFDSAGQELSAAEPILGQYPAEWQAQAKISEADSALAKGAIEIADAALAHLPANTPKSLLLDSKLDRARLLASEGRVRNAAPLFNTVERDGSERQSAEAIYYRTTAALQANTMSPNAAIAALERLRFRWRGDALEVKVLRKLGGLYFKKLSWHKGMAVLRVVTQSFPNDDAARQAEDDMRAAFVSLFLKGQADKMPPVEALSLFYDFIDLTPIGPDGDEMIRRMADRLVAVDLLEPAAGLLNYQVTKRLDGVARAEVATRLAMIDLLARKPKDALVAIKSTQLSTLPDAVAHQRTLLAARALAALKEFDQALDMIAIDQSSDAAQMRADIYWESGNWAVAGQKSEELLSARAKDQEPLSSAERATAMRAAIAYSLANDETSLERLRDQFGPRMKSTPDSSAFAVVSERIDEHGLAFRDVAAKVASIDALQNFMTDFHKRYAQVTN